MTLIYIYIMMRQHFRPRCGKMIRIDVKRHMESLLSLQMLLRSCASMTHLVLLRARRILYLCVQCRIENTFYCGQLGIMCIDAITRRLQGKKSADGMICGRCRSIPDIKLQTYAQLDIVRQQTRFCNAGRLFCYQRLQSLKARDTDSESHRCYIQLIMYMCRDVVTR